ncbi:hypothetical protein [Pontiella sulfatireligans]|uniref:hypothetical protein n=1 Tax=Pontiella sulfatireligans TaxID=2750658 RepID=UPI00109D6C1E|nr:hypothetical protein [Pontiella sulfatireligans]
MKMLIGIALLPACWAASFAVYELYQTSVGSAAASGWEAWALPIGFLLWVLLFFLLPRPVRTYVFGHELTHALWALMMGGRVGKMKVGKSGGHVELSKTNFVITLAPYFFPFYTFLIIAAYYLAGLSVEVEPYRAWWLGLVGLTWSFHITFTVHMLSQRQPDVQEHGRIFSYAVIYFMNVLVIGVWVVLVGGPEFKSFGDLLAHETTAAYSFAVQYILLARDWSASLVQTLK